MVYDPFHCSNPFSDPVPIPAWCWVLLLCAVVWWLLFQWLSQLRRWFWVVVEGFFAGLLWLLRVWLWYCGGGDVWQWCCVVMWWWWWCVVLGGDMVLMCGADLWGPFPVAEGVSTVGGWSDWSVGGDRRVVWRGWSVGPIGVVHFRWLQVWRHLFHSRLILPQRTLGSFFVVRIVVVRVCSRRWPWASDFAWFGPPEVTVCLLFLLFRCCFLLCGGGGGGLAWGIVGLSWWSLVGWSWFIWTPIWCRNGLRAGDIRGWLVLFRWGDGCLLGVISSGDYLCYSGPCSSSLALVCVFGVVKVFTMFGGSGYRWVESFPFDQFVVCTSAYHVVCLTFCVLVSGWPVTFASRSRVDV